MSLLYYVYELIDPETGVVFYVGKGKASRLYDHVKGAKKGKQSPKYAKIREILAAGYSVRHSILKRFHDEGEAYAFEAARIAEIGLENLTNVLPGAITFTKQPHRKTVATWNIKTVGAVASRFNRFFRIVLSGQRFCVYGVDMTDGIFRVMRQMSTDIGEERFFQIMRSPV